MNKERNPNCGGGVGFFVHKKFEYEVLEEESIFVEGVYESLWIKIEVAKIFLKLLAMFIVLTQHQEQALNKRLKFTQQFSQKFPKTKIIQSVPLNWLATSTFKKRYSLLRHTAPKPTASGTTGSTAAQALPFVSAHASALLNFQKASGTQAHPPNSWQRDCERLE